MTTKAEAKAKYMRKTTATAWEQGMAAGKSNWAKGVQSFYGVTPGSITQSAYDQGVSGKGAKYEAATGSKAYDKLYRKASQGISR